MMRRKAYEPEAPQGFMMTPMIDVTFQLIIFFMIVIDFASRDLEKVDLPDAKEVLEDNPADESILVFTITKDGLIKYKGSVYYDPIRDDPRQLEGVFTERRHLERFQEQRGQADLVRYYLLLRVDKSAYTEHVQRLLMMATRFGGITKILFRAVKESP